MPSSSKRSEADDTIFSAILPSEEVVQGADEITRKVYLDHGLDGKPRPISQFHVTLVYFGLYVDLQGDGMEWVKRVCAIASARTSPFQGNLNQIGHFFKPPGRSAPLVLANDQKQPGFEACYNEAFDEAKAVGLNVKREKFNPHLTTGYSVKRVSFQPIDVLSWDVGEIVLLRSFHGLTRYEELGRWALNGEGW
ncbi:2'-5' RNA ligase family protein [Haloferula sp. BvORR071]|uniref:2'-5' RNA ligase family protein n=1 Tax=Haloferula sp. BvORR071 TaxID=1396141 RepID=UPI000552651A|nr:2'-5' RNA ligase family protein [Haloferula sp. BvORR071]